MKNFKKIANLAVKDGTYMKDGKERNRYQTVGSLISTPHGSHMFIKLNATAEHDARVLSIFPEEGVKLAVAQPDNAEAVVGSATVPATTPAAPAGASYQANQRQEVVF